MNTTTQETTNETVANIIREWEANDAYWATIGAPDKRNPHQVEMEDRAIATLDEEARKELDRLETRIQRLREEAEQIKPHSLDDYIVTVNAAIKVWEMRQELILTKNNIPVTTADYYLELKKQMNERLFEAARRLAVVEGEVRWYERVGVYDPYQASQQQHFIKKLDIVREEFEEAKRAYSDFTILKS